MAEVLTLLSGEKNKNKLLESLLAPKQVLFLLQKILLKGLLTKGMFINGSESRLNRCCKSVALL